MILKRLLIIQVTISLNITFNSIIHHLAKHVGLDRLGYVLFNMPRSDSGIAPGVNKGGSIAVYEATHGTAPKYAGQDKVNPGSLILSAEMMLRDMGWTEAADLVIDGIKGAIKNKTVTYDFERLMPDAILLSSSEFGKAIIKHMDA